MKLFRDFEIRASVYFLMGIMWTFWWVLITWAYNKWLGLPADNYLEYYVGLLIIIGYVALTTNAVCILIKGLSLDIIKQWRDS